MRVTGPGLRAPWLLPLGAVLLWSVNVLVGRLAATHMPFQTISFYRWLWAALLLTPWLLPRVWRVRQQLRPHLPQLAVLSACGMVMYQGLAYLAAHYTPAAHMALLNGLIPLTTLLLAVPLLQEKIHRRSLAGSLVALLGLGLFVSQSAVVAQASQPLLGDALMGLGGVFYALYGLLLRRWPLQHLGLGVLLYVQVVLAVLWHLPLLLWLPLSPLQGVDWALIGYATLGPSLLAPLLWMQAVQRLGATAASQFLNLMPLLTAVLAWWLLREPLGWGQVLGGLLALSGVWWAQRAAP